MKGRTAVRSSHSRPRTYPNLHQQFAAVRTLQNPASHNDMTSYQTLELIASHHAEVERLCDELLEMASRLRADDPTACTLREQARALGRRLQEQLAIESSALMSDAGADRTRALAAYRAQQERLARELDEAEQKSARPLEHVNAVCSIARTARVALDRAAIA
jgi:hypothetical protein